MKKIKNNIKNEHKKQTRKKERIKRNINKKKLIKSILLYTKSIYIFLLMKKFLINKSFNFIIKVE